MDFFDKLGKKASETYKITAEKTGRFAKEAKLRMKMSEDKSEIEKLYREIGKKVYEKHLLQDSINIKEELEEECTKIDVLTDAIEGTLNEILSLKNMKQCPNCYEKIDISAKYCPNCGDKQEDPEEEKPEEDADDTDNNTADNNENNDENNNNETSQDDSAKEVEIVEE